MVLVQEEAVLMARGLARQGNPDIADGSRRWSGATRKWVVYLVLWLSRQRIRDVIHGQPPPECMQQPRQARAGRSSP